MNTSRIEILRKDRLDDLLSIEAASFSNPWTRDHFISAMKSPHLEIITHCSGDSVNGYIVLYRIRQILVIANLAVKASCRRRGMGKKLLEAGLRWGKDNNCSYSVLDVRESNAEAVRLYEKTGFIIIGSNKDYYQNPVEDSVVMGKMI